jgi:hypothetical protein
MSNLWRLAIRGAVPCSYSAGPFSRLEDVFSRLKGGSFLSVGVGCVRKAPEFDAIIEQARNYRALISLAIAHAGRFRSQRRPEAFSKRS